jgi:hypothetical protein
MACFDSNSRKAQTSADTRVMSLMASLTRSTQDHARPLIGKLQLKLSTGSSAMGITTMLRRPLESALRSAVRMVNEPERGALALCGHQQGRERQFGPHVIPHCLSHDLARREIKDGSQIEPAIAGRNVCDICQPYPARRRCEEPLREQVWGDREGVTTVGRARAKPRLARARIS